MDLRPQAHDIIRTWLFATVLRAHLEHDSLPWTHAAISGWVLDPDRKKMSKSKGNVVTPMALLEEHGSDGVRYWAASGRPGHRHGVRPAADEGRPPAGDQAAERGEVRADAGRAARADHRAARPRHADEPRGARATSRPSSSRTTTTRACSSGPRRFFWDFCDDYLELVKSRRYGDFGAEGAASANSAMLVALSTLLRLFAPFLPFVTEEVWSWWQPGSVHRATWPTPPKWSSIDRRRGRPRRCRSSRARSERSARCGA